MIDEIYIHEYGNEKHIAEKEDEGFGCSACGMPPGTIDESEITKYIPEKYLKICKEYYQEDS